MLVLAAGITLLAVAALEMAPVREADEFTNPALESRAQGRCGGGAAGRGARRMKPPGEDVLTSTTAELEPNRLLGDVTDLGELVVRVEHRPQPSAGGGTSITYRVQVSGPAANAAGEEVGTAVSADFPDVVAPLAAAAASRG